MAHEKRPADRGVDQEPPRRDPASREARAERAASRLVIPAVLVVVGVVLMIVGVTWVGAVIVIAGVIALVADLIIRMGIDSQDDRDREAAARREMRRRGRWPR